MEHKSPNSKPTVLVCPLDWGIGHATRCVPVIDMLLLYGCKVIIAADKLPLAFLRLQFPLLEYVRMPSFNVSYSKKIPLSVKMLFSFPAFINSIIYDNRQLKKIISNKKIDIVISDNRYGLFSNSNVFSVFITHQLMIKCPKYLRFCEPALRKFVLHFIKKFDECWIPDFNSNINLSGDLSHKFPLPSNAFFINPLSRFDNNININNNIININNKNSSESFILIMLSGPEPQRTILENKIISSITQNEANMQYRFIILRGKPDSSDKINLSEKIILYSHLNTESIKMMLLQSELVICRPGYSSIMDIVAMGKKAVFIPTPGQTEQEYLAEYLSGKNLFYHQKQNDFNLPEAIQKANEFKGINAHIDNQPLSERINHIINNYHKNPNKKTNQ